MRVGLARTAKEEELREYRKIVRAANVGTGRRISTAPIADCFLSTTSQGTRSRSKRLKHGSLRKLHQSDSVVVGTFDRRLSPPAGNICIADGV